VEVVASLSQGRTAAAQCGLFTHKSVPVIFEPPCATITFCFFLSFPFNFFLSGHSLTACSLYKIHYTLTTQLILTGHVIKFKVYPTSEPQGTNNLIPNPIS